MIELDELKAIGSEWDMLPTPIDPENTQYFPAGPLSIGLEYRRGGSQSTLVNFRDTPGKIQELIASFKERDEPTQDRGVSFHICDGATGTEYVRLDAFDDGPNTQGPHYHYIHPEEGSMTVVRFDESAQGPMFDWALELLSKHGDRLAPMLRRAGADALADQVEQELDTVVAALPAIADEAKRADLDNRAAPT
jgi:hypothetical protein